ncbi:inovirus-type Gp2 protein [Zhongshania guokunii]|uniref:Inovirus-type Gp2 protein n=1 Tax=Zhongshania guokunii TaxID=641783 RepID=A0ABV3U9B9_9GAMM
MKKIVSGNVMVNGYPLQLGPGKAHLGHYLEILQAAADQLDAMLSHHSKVLVFRIDFHLHAATTDNAPMSGFVRRFRKKLSRRDFKRLGFIWCREHNTGNAQHYHATFIVDGNKCRHPHNLIKLIQYEWEWRELGRVYVPANCYYLVRRNAPYSAKRALARMSYLAKVDTKQQRSASTNDYSASRLRHRLLPAKHTDAY